MSDVEKKPTETPGAAVGIGVLTLLAAGLSFAIYQTSGEWPAELGGWGVVLFLALSVALVGYSWWDSR